MSIRRDLHSVICYEMNNNDNINNNDDDDDETDDIFAHVLSGRFSILMSFVTLFCSWRALKLGIWEEDGNDKRQ